MGYVFVYTSSNISNYYFVKLGVAIVVALFSDIFHFDKVRTRKTLRILWWIVYTTVKVKLKYKFIYQKTKISLSD